MKNNKKRFTLSLSKGFTLVEMLMVMGIMSILVVILAEVFGSILTMKLRSEATTAVAQDSRYLLSRLYYDISRASDITSTSGDSLSLVIDGVEHLYSLADSTLTLAVGGGSSQALSSIGSRVTGLTFTRTDLGTKEAVHIQFTINPVIILPGGADLSRDLATTVALR